MSTHQSGLSSSGFNDKISVILADALGKVVEPHLHQLIISLCQQLLSSALFSVDCFDHRLHLLNMLAHLHHLHVGNVNLLRLILYRLIQWPTVLLLQQFLVLFQLLFLLLPI